MVWRMSVGDSVGEVAEMVGYSKKWTKEIKRRYESEGVEGLGDRRHSIPGPRRGLCSTRRQHSFVKLFWKVRLRAEGCGVGLRWRAGSNRETDWIRCMSSVVLSTWEGGYESPGTKTLQCSRGPSLREGGFQKSLGLKLEKLEQAHPEAEVQLWAEDETRVGLKPLMSGYGLRWDKGPSLDSTEATNGPISTVSFVPRAERFTG